MYFRVKNTFKNNRNYTSKQSHTSLLVCFKEIVFLKNSFQIF